MPLTSLPLPEKSSSLPEDIVVSLPKNNQSQTNIITPPSFYKLKSLQNHPEEFKIEVKRFIEEKSSKDFYPAQIAASLETLPWDSIGGEIKEEVLKYLGQLIARNCIYLRKNKKAPDSLELLYKRIFPPNLTLTKSNSDFLEKAIGYAIQIFAQDEIASGSKSKFNVVIPSEMRGMPHIKKHFKFNC